MCNKTDNMWNKKFQLGIIFLIFSISIFGQENENNLFDCYDGSQTEMNICSLKEHQHYDSILNVKYKELMNVLNTRIKEYSKFDDDFESKEAESFKNSIIESQRSWIVLRDKNKKIKELMYIGGSMCAMAMNIQLTHDTKKRIEFIDELIESESR